MNDEQIELLRLAVQQEIEYSILYPVDTALYDILTQKHFEVSK